MVIWGERGDFHGQQRKPSLREKEKKEVEEEVWNSTGQHQAGGLCLATLRKVVRRQVDRVLQLHARPDYEDAAP